jgi:response regulator RpfG family c-di-GMP phosphodiesterase
VNHSTKSLNVSGPDVSVLKDQHTILAVDDEPINLRMLERLLRKHFRVLTATSADEALKILQRERVSLLLTDQRMPGMLGTELLRESRALHPDMVRMVVTATNDSETFIDAIKHSGAVRVISKPWDPDKVLQAITDALLRYESLLENKAAINRLKRANADLNKIVRGG